MHARFNQDLKTDQRDMGIANFDCIEYVRQFKQLCSQDVCVPFPQHATLITIQSMHDLPKSPIDYGLQYIACKVPNIRIRPIW